MWPTAVAEYDNMMQRLVNQPLLPISTGNIIIKVQCPTEKLSP